MTAATIRRALILAGDREYLALLDETEHDYITPTADDGGAIGADIVAIVEG